MHIYDQKPRKWDYESLILEIRNKCFIKLKLRRIFNSFGMKCLTHSSITKFVRQNGKSSKLIEIWKLQQIFLYTGCEVAVSSKWMIMIRSHSYFWPFLIFSVVFIFRCLLELLPNFLSREIRNTSITITSTLKM